MVKALVLGLALFGALGCATAKTSPQAPAEPAPTIACDGANCGANPSICEGANCPVVAACDNPPCVATCQGAACPPPCEGPTCVTKAMAAPAPACTAGEPGCSAQPILELR